MDIPVFPAELGLPLLEEFSETLQDPLVRTEVQSGRQRTRLRHTAPILNIIVRYRFTPEMYALWLAFESRCIEYGNLSFRIDLPIRGHNQTVTAKILQITERPKEPGVPYFYTVVEFNLQVTEFTNAPIIWRPTVIINGVRMEILYGNDNDIRDFVEVYESSVRPIYETARDFTF